MQHTGKIALITGGSRGLGKDMAMRLAERGNHIIITYNAQKDAADAVVAAIEQTGCKAAALQLNTGKPETFSEFTVQLQQTLLSHFGATHINYLVNNAGTSAYVPFADVTEALFDELMNIHFKGVYFLTQKLLPLIADGSGIVNISSGLARFSMPGSSVYASMKGAVEVLTRYMAKELGARGIRANVVAPGAIMTDFGGGRLRGSEQLQQTIAGITALGRPGVPEDIGGVVAFLCSDDARWVNGQRIEASGGMYV